MVMETKIPYFYADYFPRDQIKKIKKRGRENHSSGKNITWKKGEGDRKQYHIPFKINGVGKNIKCGKVISSPCGKFYNVETREIGSTL